MDQLNIISKQVDDTNNKNNNDNNKVGVLSNRIQEPLKLKILILSGTEIMVKELENIKFCSNLLKLDISSNRIQSFPKNVTFKHLHSLKLLYLHNNLIDDAETLYKIFEIPNLIYLTLFNNPLSTKWSLRHFIVNSMPNLFAFDFNAISDEERMEQVVRTDRFYALSPSTKINWPLITIPQETVVQDDEYLLLLREEMKIIIMKYSENSPTVIIQRMWRGHQCRKQLKNRLKTAEDRLNLSQRVSSHWKKHTVRKLTLKQLLQERGKEYLLYEKKSYEFHRGLDKLKKLFREYLYRFRIKKQMQMAARIILKAFKRMKSFLNSYQTVLFPQPLLPSPPNSKNNKQINTPAFQKQKYINKQNKNNNNSNQIDLQRQISTPQQQQQQSLPQQPITIYFHRDQIQQFYEIFNDCQRYISNSSIEIYKEVQKNLKRKYMKKAERIIGLRVIESQESKNHIYYSKYPFNALMRPSLRSKVLFTKTDSKYYDMQYHPFFTKFKRAINLPNMDHELKKPQMSSFDWEKYRYLYQKLSRFQEKEYECLMEFTCPDVNIAQAFTKEIISYNHKAYHGGQSQSSQTNEQDIKQNIQENNIYLEDEEQVGLTKPIDEQESNFITSVVNQQQEETNKNNNINEDNEFQNENVKKNIIIKKKPLFLVFFKSYLLQVSSATKIQKMWRYYKSKNNQINVFGIIQQKRACSKIQHWVRNIRWYHKRSLLSQLSYYIHSSISQETLYIHFTTYQSLIQIHNKITTKQTLTLLEQDNIISYSPQKGIVRLIWNFDNHYSNQLSEMCNRLNLYYKRIFPKWLKLSGDTGQKDMSDDEYFGDIMHLLHVQTKMGILELGGMKFVKIEFANLQEAKYRAAALALNTYRFRNNGYFIKLFTHAQISNYSYILSEETDLKATYNLDLQYDTNRCLVRKEIQINNEQGYFISSKKKQEFNEKSIKICKHHQIENIIMYKETLNNNNNNYQIIKNSQTSLNQQNQKYPTKLEVPIHIYLNDNIYIYKQINSQVIISSKIKNINDTAIRVSIETPSFDMPIKKGLPIFTNDTSTKYANTEFDSTVISFYKGNNNNNNYNNVNTISTPYSKYRSKPLLDTSVNNIVTDVSILKDQKRQQSSDFQSILKEREEQSLIARQKGIQDSKKRSYLIKEIKSMDKSIALNEMKQITLVDKRNRKFKKEVEQIFDIESKLQKVEVLKQIGMSTKSEEMWTQNFNRSQNYLVKQMAQYNKKKAQDDVFKKNMVKANKVRERKLIGTANTQNRPQSLSQSSHARNRTESSFYTQSSHQNNFMLTSMNEIEAIIGSKNNPNTNLNKPNDRNQSLQPFSTTSYSQQQQSQQQQHQIQQQNPSTQFQFSNIKRSNSKNNKNNNSKRLNTFNDVLCRTTTNGSYGMMETQQGILQTEPNESNNKSFESTMYNMNQIYHNTTNNRWNQRVLTEGGGGGGGNDDDNNNNNKSFLNKSLLQDKKYKRINTHKTPTAFNNKIVHAVFPEEFYPISTGSNQFKLQL